MAIYAFSTLSNGQEISFNPNSDVLNFDQTAISAADLSIAAQGSNLSISAAGKSIVLDSVSALQLATSNITFANGSLLLFGDNSPGTANDNAANTLNGSAGNDLFQGFGGADTLNGGNGNDTYIVGSGDSINDTGGTDTILTDVSYNLSANIEDLTMTGTANINTFGNGVANVIQGNAGNNTVWAGGGNDTVYGGSGNDYLGGDAGSDWLDGQAGNDTLDGGGGPDQFAFSLYGTADSDTVVNFASDWDSLNFDIAAFGALGTNGRFASGDVRFYAAAGASGGHDADDRIIYNTSTGQLFYDADGNGSGAAQLIATLQGAPTLMASDIYVFGTPASNGAINGTPGDDTLVGTPGNDTINGLGGNDSISGLGGDDSLFGGDGNDTLDGGAGADTMDGGLGNDTYYADFADQIIDAGGLDTVIANSGGVRSSWTLGPGLENLIVYGTNGTGNELNNVITNMDAGIPGSTINGMGGDDTLIGSFGHEDFVFTGDYGHDVVDGGAGATDEIIAGDSSAVLVDFRTGTASGGGPGGSGTISFTNVERAAGGDFNDTLIGASGANGLFGNGGDDLLNGGAGNDFMNGGAGADRFLFDQTGSANSDQVIDFSSGIDQIHLDATAMPALGVSGEFAPGDTRFYAAAGATEGHDADDRVIYDTSTGNLYYDADGSGAGAAQILGTIFFAGAAATVSATDIYVDNGTQPGVINGTGSNDSLVGTAGNDTISGLDGNDTLNGLAGDDVLDGGNGTDSLNGGDGNDTYFVTAGDLLNDSSGIDTVMSPVAWNLGAGFENLTFTGTANVNGFGNSLVNVITGNAGANTVWAGDGNDTVLGGDGNDYLGGDAGSDWLNGQHGNDTLDGGGGQDHFVFGNSGAADADAVVNYASGWDDLQFDHTAFGALGAPGQFSTNDARFYAAAGAAGGHDADDRLVYNTSTGQLYYDDDGSGAHAAQLVATLQGAAPLAASDVHIF